MKKDLSYVIRKDDLTNVTRLEDIGPSQDEAQIVIDREVVEYTSENDACFKIQRLLKAIELKENHIMLAACFEDIEEFLIDSRLVNRSGKLERLGKQLKDYVRGDVRFINLTAEVLTELRKNNSRAAECIDEVMNTFMKKGIAVVTVNEGLHWADDKAKLFFEHLGVLGKAERFNSLNVSPFYVKPITESGKKILSLLSDRINSMEENNRLPLFNNSFNEWFQIKDNKFFSNIKTKVTTISTNYHINIYIFVIAIVIAVVVLIGFIFKIVTEFFPTSLI